MNGREDRLGAVLAIGGSVAGMALLARVVGRGASEPPPIPNNPEVGVAGWTPLPVGMCAIMQTDLKDYYPGKGSVMWEPTVEIARVPCPIARLVLAWHRFMSSPRFGYYVMTSEGRIYTES